MSLQDTELDTRVQIIMSEMETRPLRGGFVVHDNTDPINHISDALRLADKTADIFWGNKRVVNGEVVPQTVLAKIGLIRDAVRVIPETDDLPQQVYYFTNEEIDIELIMKYEKRKEGVRLDPTLAAYFKKPPQSAIEAYRTPSVRELAHTALLEIGDPVTQIIDVYERYHDNSPAIESHALALGTVALEHAAFGAGGQALVTLLGSANRVFHEGEVSRRKLNN